jgi:hypothetical protein
MKPNQLNTYKITLKVKGESQPQTHHPIEAASPKEAIMFLLKKTTPKKSKSKTNERIY